MLDLVLLPFLFWLGLAGSIICTCFIVCSLIWLLHRDPGQVVVASTCGGTTWSATVGWAYSCAAVSGRSRASRKLNEPPILGLAPTGCQARGGRCHEVRVLLGVGGHCGKIDSAKLSVNKQHSLYSCVVLYTMVVWRHDLWLASICDCGTICDHIMLQFVTRHDLWPKVLQFVTSVIQWF